MVMLNNSVKEIKRPEFSQRTVVIIYIFVFSYNKSVHKGLILIIIFDDLSNFIFTWWRHQMETFSALLAICAGNSPAPVNSPHKRQWRGALMLSLICARINGWVNNREAGDLRRYRAHYDVSVMKSQLTFNGKVKICWLWSFRRPDRTGVPVRCFICHWREFKYALHRGVSFWHHGNDVVFRRSIIRTEGTITLRAVLECVYSAPPYGVGFCSRLVVIDVFAGNVDVFADFGRFRFDGNDDITCNSKHGWLF